MVDAQPGFKLLSRAKAVDGFRFRPEFAALRDERVIVRSHPIQGSGIAPDNSLISVTFDLQSFFLRTVVESGSCAFALDADKHRDSNGCRIEENASVHSGSL
jgi:hypothetical protein